MRSTLARSSKAVNLRLRGSCYAFDVAASAVLAQILQLPAEERAKLAFELLRSLDDRADRTPRLHGMPNSIAAPTSSTRAIAKLRGCPRG